MNIIKKPANYLLNRFTEGSTYIGLILAVAGIFGLDIDPEQGSALVDAIITLVSVLLVLWKQNKTKDIEVFKPKE